jgi:hypothetical protein
MLRSIFSILLCSILLTSCGVRRPLIAPKDIPAYEAKRAKQMERYKADALKPADSPDDESEQ